MNIFYVDALYDPSELKSIDSYKSIDVGDICFVKNNRHYIKCIVITQKIANLKWSDFTCLESRFILDNYQFESILCGIDNINKRSGCLEGLSVLSNLFNDKVIIDLLNNAIDILLYKEDKWNTKYLQNLYKQTIETPSDELEKSEDQFEDEIPFVAFFNKEIKKHFYVLYKSTTSLSVIFRDIRKKYPKDFSSAIKAFNKVYPDKSIYFIKASDSQTECNTAQKISDIDLICSILRKNGFIQQSEKVWTSASGHEICIDMKMLNNG